MQTEPTVRTFETRNEAMSAMRSFNIATRCATKRRELRAVVPGPENNWAVVDLNTAIELGNGYEFEG